MIRRDHALRFVRLAPAAGLVLAAAMAVFTPRAGGQNVAVDELRRKQEIQQSAVVLARDLVRRLLDVQMQQLEENGLTDRPLYTDVKTMRENLDGLVESEMKEVVSLLAKAQADTSNRRDETFLMARQKISEVLTGLLAEQQSLANRLRTAEIAAQVRRLVEMETTVRDATSTLPLQTREQRELRQLSTLNDQRDVRKVYDKLLETLSTARGWEGEISRTAVDCLSLLKAGQTSTHVEGADTAIESGDFATAVEHESAAIRGLQVLLKKVKEKQGLIQADRTAALDVVRELMRRQDELTEATKAAQAEKGTRPEQAKQDELAQKQTALGRELTKLADMVLDKPQAAPLVERAEKASEAAAIELFNAESPQAVKSQTMVRASLAAVEKQLLEETESALPDDRDAARLARRATDLEKVRDELKQARAKIAPLAKSETPLPPTAKATLDQAAKEVARAGHERDLPAPTAAKIRDAARAARDAAKAQDDSTKSAEAKRDEAAKADAALERAQAEVEAAAADVRRMQPAVAAAELSRAAEALDRAAAAERDVAMRAVAEASKPAGRTDREAIASLTDDHRLAAAVAADVAEAVGGQSPEAKQTLAEAKAAAEEATKQLMGPSAPQTGTLPPNAQAPSVQQSTAQQPNAPKVGAQQPAGPQAGAEKPGAQPPGAQQPGGPMPDNTAKPQAGAKTQPEGTTQAGAAAPAPNTNRPAGQNPAGGAQPAPNSPTPADLKTAAATKTPPGGEPNSTAARSSEGAPQGMPPEGASPSAAPPSPQALRNAAAQANAAAQKMAAAASQLRRKAAEQAGNLIKESDKQLAAVTPAAKGVDQAAAANNMSNAEAQAAVAAAKRAVEKAEAEQLRASGRPEAAQLQELAGKIEQAAAMQRAADADAKKPARDPAEALDAVTMQQQAADETEKLLAEAEARPAAKAAEAGRKPDPLVEQLRSAKRAAQEAAKQALAGKPAEALQARADAKEALAAAAAAAKAEQAETAQKPATGKVDPAAQQRATTAIADAKKNAMAHAPLSTDALDKAEKDSMAAEQAGLAAQREPSAAKEGETAAKQKSVAEKLGDAKKALDNAAAQLAAQGAEQMKKQAEATGKLAEQAAALDPDALAALREAQQAAAGAAAQPKPMPAEAAAARKEAAQSMQRAVASLAAREQTVRRDQQLGQAMLASLAEQAMAAQEIAAQRAALSQAAAQMKPPEATAASPPQQATPAQTQARASAETAARKLDAAMESFSQNAQVTGQAAQEVSGQNQIANPALAMALDKASALPTPALPADAAAEQPAGDTAQADAQIPGAQAPQGASAPRPTRQSEKATGLEPPAQMGKSFTPNSAETTARMMAGRQAMQQMTQLAQGSTPPKPGNAPGQMANTAAAQQAQAGQPGQSTQTSRSPQELQGRPSQAARDSSQPFVNNSGRNMADTTLAAGRPAADEPWMAKLPAELRNAMRAEAQRPAPRGYEERLRNYFKNID